MEEKNLLEIQDLVIRFHTDDGVIEAVNGISLSLKAGETLGLILSIRHFGKTVLALALLAAAAFCAANVPILLLILPGAVSLCLSYLIEPVFSQYIKKDAVFSAKDIWKISQE